MTEKLSMRHGSFSLKSLAPADARMAISVLRFTEQELGVSLRGQRLLLALSGGADSTALLVMFCALRSYADFSVAAAHLDHGLRPESMAEARSANLLCEQFQVPFFTERVDVSAVAAERHCGLEEAGRIVRYAFLEQCRQKFDASWVLTAHHLGDLAEDVLMRLVRGASWPALGGMSGVIDEPGRHLLRPLLMLEKKQLTGFLERCHILWSEDSSNQSRLWRRNRIRHDVLPLLLAENPSFYQSIRRVWRCAREDAQVRDARVEQALILCNNGVLITAEVLNQSSRPERLAVMAGAVRRMKRGQPRADTLEAMDAVWQRRHFPRRFSFAGEVKAEISAAGIRFYIAPGR